MKNVSLNEWVAELEIHFWCEVFSLVAWLDVKSIHDFTITYISPVEAFTTGTKMFEALDRLVFKSQKSNCTRTFLIH